MSTLLEKLIGSAALKDNPLKCLCIKLKPGSVTTDKIADKAVTPAKLSDSVKNLGNHVFDTTKHITAQERSTWNSKQDALTFDNLPTQGSNNPVKSGGVYSKIQDLTTTAQLIRDDVSAIQQEMPGKQNVLTFDNTPTANSDNPVKSKGIKSAIDDVQAVIDSRISYNKLDFKKTIAADSHNEINVKARTPEGSSDGHVEINTDNLIINNTENADINLASDSNVDFGGIGSITSDMDMTIQAGKDGVSTGDLNLNGTNVKVNGTNIDTIKNNAQNALNKINAMYPDEGKGMRIETSGIYYAYPDLGNPDIIPSSMGHSTTTGYLLLVTTTIEMDAHGGVYKYLHQLIIDIVTGRKAIRTIDYDDSTIDWSTAPNFTEV